MSFGWETFTELDRQLFVILNGWHAPWADVLMNTITFKYTWVPLYVILIGLAVRRHRARAYPMLLTAILAVGLADWLASGLLKPWVARPRPCHDPALAGLLHLVDGCGGPFGFVSSHASTSFALALVLSQLLKSTLPGIPWLYAWAVLYSYSRIYVGVHLPGDILGGALVGLLSGTLLLLLYKMFYRKKYGNIL
ncbi:lipid A 4'-phosphatase [Rhabdobacter roseus]|uniref:Undecaprenyl-diphosphatase n=1 Tax=Rhabdobacter roseus TaxID=1655419 RepID=A0A840TNZ9_9BACT|nr:phosphatase PAP2 family protein [Rhabdobacter roseus]MBB5283282.1 undecaprenyl-diphosphatase [Rhabdobacter roseus]